MVLPFYPHAGTGAAVDQLHDAVDKAREIGALCVVVEDGCALLDGTGDYYLHTRLTSNSGKIAATRAGIEVLRRAGFQGFVGVCDWDEEQDIRDLAALHHHSRYRKCNVVIGDRYGFHPAETWPPHRHAVNYVQRCVAKTLGFDAHDLVSGLVGCRWEFALKFLKSSRAERLAVGFDWAVLAFLGGYDLQQIPVRAPMRSASTDAIKLADTFAIIARYGNELAKAGRSSLVTFVEALAFQLRAGRAEFDVPVGLIGGDRRCTARRLGDAYSWSLDEPLL